MSYIVRYRAGFGRSAPVRRVTIAKIGKVTPELARERARELLADVVKGADPAKERSDYRSAPAFEQVAKKFLEHIELKRKPSTALSYKQLLAKHAYPAFGSKKAVEVSAEDVEKLHLKLAATPMAANRLRAVISSMYNWATTGRKKHLPVETENPAVGLMKYPEGRRERFLSTDEISLLAAAINEGETSGIPWEPDPAKKTKHAPKPENRRLKIDPAVAAALRLYILTGARRGEILSLTWEMVDLERGLLFLPDSKTGQKTIILNAPAQLILSELPRIDKFVIPGRAKVGKNGKIESRARHDIKRPWTLIRKRAGLLSETDDPRYRVRLHDLRHTHASIGVGSNLGLPIVGKLLGHKQARTTERYAHLDIDPVRKASDAIGSRIMDAMGGRKTERDNVVPMRPGKSK